MTYLGVDFGDKRTGLAVGDEQTGIASPLQVIASRDVAQVIEQVRRQVIEQRAQAVVVGLPLNMDGTRGPAAAKAQRFAERLRGVLAVPVILSDERLTSFVAEGQLSGTGLNRRQKKARRDALAAAAILRDFWSGKSSSP